MSTTFLAETETLAGIKVRVDRYKVLVGDVAYEFNQPLDFDAIIQISASISAHFIAIISQENEENGGHNFLYLITVTTPGKLYIDLIQEIDFKYSCFSADQTKLIALTARNTIQYYNTIPPQFIKEFHVGVQFPAIAMDIVEANGVMQITQENGAKQCFFLPTDFSPESQNALREADESYLTLFSPVESGEATVEEAVVDDAEIDEIDNGNLPQDEKEFSEMVLSKAVALKNKENELVEKRNTLARKVVDLHKRSKDIRRRENEAQQKAKQLFFRIQKLIESKDGGRAIMRQREQMNQAEQEFKKISIPELVVDAGTIYNFRNSNFKERLARVKAHIEK